MRDEYFHRRSSHATRNYFSQMVSYLKPLHLCPVPRLHLSNLFEFNQTTQIIKEIKNSVKSECNYLFKGASFHSHHLSKGAVQKILKI